MIGNKRPLKIIITTGDLDGIGMEVTVKALVQLHSKNFFLKETLDFYIFKSPKISPYEKGLKNIFDLNSFFFNSNKELFSFFDLNSGESDSITETNSILKTKINSKIKRKKPRLTFLISNFSPASWVENAASLCLDRFTDAMVTAPLSKTEIHSSGLKDIGHTDILKRVTKTRHAFMGFSGKFFNVVLATGHYSIKKIPQQLKPTTLTAAISEALKLRKSKTKPIGLLGLNPHASDQGLIGDEENKILLPLIKTLRNKGFLIEGPLVPDVAFQRQNWARYSVFVSLYHDQGLIPFKLIHGHGGSHVTLGLPIIRSSVDHGTAKDIFNKNKANPASMIEAIKLSIKLAKGGSHV